MSSSPTFYYLKNINKLISHPHKTVGYTVDDCKIIIRPRTIDGYIINEIFENNDYAPVNKKIELNNGVFIDLGAHIGIFSVWANLNYSPAKIICIEPFPDNLRLLDQNLSLNNVDAKIIPKALSNDHSDIKLRKVPFNTGGHSVTDKGNLTLPTITLEEILKNTPKVDFLKVDIEGSEKILFEEENLKIISKKVKFIKMEVHIRMGLDISDVKRKLENVGFEVFEIKQPLFKGMHVRLIEAYSLRM